MGSSFFQKGGQPKIVGSNQGLEARAIGSSAYGARTAGAGAQKSLGVAAAINKAGAHTALKRSAAYPKGPKI
jgi:hypothetical protein